ncbi:MAG: pro-sigmaK processing inhibitor BofA family protein [Bacilli bacterium]|nr:pro-sigmaK processing inhibitor BofA family protein [Bacilli bacterium]MBQ9833685.1 pro-sigmaK processing inhibitor BofA family protein [Bacilli bacterium]
MFKVLFKVLKRVLFAFIFLYSFNLLVSSININIPVNLISIGIVSCLGTPGLLSLVIMSFIVK